MSYILDALKKAESERSRQSGPVLMDVRIAAPRRRLPVWAWIMGGVLLANMFVLAWLLLRKPDDSAQVMLANTAAAPAAAAATAAPAPLAAAPAATLPAPPPAAAPVAEPPPVVTALPPASPLPAATAGTPPVIMPPVQPLNIDSLPTMQDLIASGVTLPALQLNLHVYDEAPGNRFVLLNSKRLREGDELPDGILLERITPRGAVLNVNGRRFVLVAGG